MYCYVSLDHLNEVYTVYVCLCMYVYCISLLTCWQVSIMHLQLPLVATLQVDVVLVLVTIVALWTRLSQLSYPNAVVWVSMPELYTHTHTHKFVRKSYLFFNDVVFCVCWGGSDLMRCIMASLCLSTWSKFSSSMTVDHLWVTWSSLLEVS